MTTSKDKVSRPRLSVAMIVRNEQEVLAASIESVRPIADEIVVLDTGSTDQTIAIAEDFGAVVNRTPWEDDFSAARNRCLETVTGDWVLWLDAGERLDEESARELREFVDRQADPNTAYMLMVQAPPIDPAASGEEAAKLRLIPNRAGLRFEGRVRETLQPSLQAAGLRIDIAAGCIVRHPRQHDPARKVAIAWRDLQLAGLQSDDPPAARLLLVMGEALSNLGEEDKARKAFLAAIKAAESGSTEMLDGYYGLLTTYSGVEGPSQLQLTVCLEALEIFPLDAQLLLAMGNYMQLTDRVDLAGRSFETAVKHGQVDLETWHLSELAEVAANCFSLALQVQGKADEARDVLEESLQRSPNSRRLRRRLIDLHVECGRCEQAIEVADPLTARPDDREPLRNAIRGACEAAAQRWTTALGHLQTAYLGGCSDPLCLRWLSVTLLSNGQVQAAEPVLQEWQQLEPSNPELQNYLTTIRRGETTPEDQTTPPKRPAGQQFRVDPQTTVFEAAPPILPIISQSSSADAVDH